MNNSLGAKVSIASLIRFTTPTIIMMVFMSTYTMVDGIFVSRFVGTGALSAVNIVYPVMSVMIAVGIMLGTGGSAVVAKQMGEDKPEEAKASFSLIALAGGVAGFVILAAGLLWLEPLVMLLGSNAAIHDYCMQYGFWLLIFSPMCVLQTLFQPMFVAAGKPMIGLAATIAGGATNILLDYLLIVPFNMGIAGAAIATGCGMALPTVFGLFYFTFSKSATLSFVPPCRKPQVLAQSCLNGMSEMVSNLAAAVTTYLFNIVMMNLAGEDGVAAITIVLYSQFLLTAIYLGYSSGVAPMISYNYGSRNNAQLQRIFRISLGFIAVCSVITFAASFFVAAPLVSIFTGDNASVFELAHHGFLLFSCCYLFMGFNIFASSMFTAFSDGRVSAIISFLRTFVLIVASVLLLPRIIGLDGVWLAIPLAELLTLAASSAYMVLLRHKYGYA